MGMGTEVGDAYVEIHADTKGLRGEIKRAAKEAGADYSEDFGKSVGSSIDKDLSPAGRRLRSSLARQGKLAGNDFSKTMGDVVKKRVDKFHWNLAKGITLGDWTKVLKQFDDIDTGVRQVSREMDILRGKNELTAAQHRDALASLDRYVNKAGEASRVNVYEETNRGAKTFARDSERLLGNKSRWFKRGSSSGSSWGNGFRGGALSRMDGTVKLVLGLIAAAGPEIAALGSALGSTLTATLGSTLIGVAGALGSLTPVAITAAAGFKLLSNGVKDVLKESPKLLSGFQSIATTWTNAGKTLATNLAPQLNAFGDKFTEVFGNSSIVTGLTTALGTITTAFTTALSSPGMQAFITALGTTLPDALASLGTGAASALGGLGSIFAAAAPAAKILGDAFAAFGENFATTMDGLSKNGQLEQFFTAATGSLKLLMGVIGPLAKALGNVFLAGQDTGNGMLQLFGDLAQQFLDFTNSIGGEAALAEWFSNGATILAAFVPLVGAVGTALSDLVTPEVVAQLVAFMGSLTELAPLLGDVLAVLGQAGVLNILAQALVAIGTALSPIMPVLGQLAATIGGVLSQAITALMPAFDALAGVIGVLAQALIPLLPIFGQLLAAVGPVIAALANALAPIIAMLGEALGPVIASLTPVIAALAPVITNLITALMPFLKIVIDLAAGIITALAPVLAQLLGLIADLAPSVVGIVLAFVPFVRVIALLAPVILPVVKVVAQLLSWVIKLIEPITGLLNAVVPVIASFLSFKGIMKDLGKIAGPIGGMFSKVGGAISGAFGTAVQAVKDAIGAIPGLLGGLPSKLIGILKGMGTALANAARFAWNLYFGAVKAYLTFVFNFVKALPGRLLGILKSMGTALANAARFAWNLYFGAVKAYLTFVFNFVKALPGRLIGILRAMGTALAGAARTAWTIYFTTAKAVLNAVITFVRKIPGRILGILKGIGSALAGAAKTAWTIYFTTAKAVINTIITFVRKLPGRVASGISSLASKLSSLAGTAWNAFFTKSKQIFDTVVAWAKGIPQKIISGIGSLTTTLSSIGGDLVSGLVSGISGAWHWVTSKVDELVGKIPKAIRKLLGIASPSKVMIEIGKNMVAGLAKGITDSTKSVMYSIRKQVGAIKNIAAREFKEIGKLMGKSLGLGVAETSDENVNRVRAGIDKLNEDINKAQIDAIDKRAHQLINARKVANEKISNANKHRAKGTDAKDSLPSLNIDQATKLATKQLKKVNAAVNAYQKKLSAQKKRKVSVADLIDTNWGKNGNKNFGKLKTTAKAQSATLADIAAARTAVAGKLEIANQALQDQLDAKLQFSTQVIEAAKAYASAMNTVAKNDKTPITSKDVTTQMSDRLAALVKFNADVAKLTASGLNKDTLREIVEGGVEGGGDIASALVAGGKGAVTEVNKLQTSINAEAKKLGDSTASTFYDTGIDAAQGLVDGLAANDKALKQAAEKLADKIITAFNKKMGIKSPSRVMIEAASHIPEGVTKGILAGRRAVGNAMAAIMPNPARGQGNATVTAVGSAGGGGGRSITVAPGAIQVVVPTANPTLAASAMLDALVARTR